MSDMIYFKTLIIEDKQIDKKTIEGKRIVQGLFNVSANAYKLINKK